MVESSILRCLSFHAGGKSSAEKRQNASKKNIMKTKISILFAAFFVLIGNVYSQYCTNDARYTEVQFFDSTDITIAANVQYGIATDFQGNPDTLLMDLYYPNLVIDTSPQRPLMLLFHGGGSL